MKEEKKKIDVEKNMLITQEKLGMGNESPMDEKIKISEIEAIVKQELEKRDRESISKKIEIHKSRAFWLSIATLVMLMLTIIFFAWTIFLDIVWLLRIARHGWGEEFRGLAIISLFLSAGITLCLSISALVMGIVEHASKKRKKACNAILILCIVVFIFSLGITIASLTSIEPAFGWR